MPQCLCFSLFHKHCGIVIDQCHPTLCHPSVTQNENPTRDTKLNIKENQVFDRFRLSYQLRSSADPINYFGVIHAADLET
ncbi:hypothetical protein MTR_6g004980 [Medicago truncatula]|uniref:Uncharacterized protein n=1 Tax=Medicago truncatula TaxID=3880 RepID=A0A072U6N6_MEDTR|nr:hypothetical protein MTR_6g004980 [Medicago truncatula]